MLLASIDSNPVDEAARKRFEQAWRSGSPGPLESYLPPENDPRRPGTLEELVHIDLELGWKSGAGVPSAVDAGDTAADAPVARQRPLLESYLQRFPDLKAPDVMRRLLQQEFAVRHRYGDRPSRATYAARFPGIPLEHLDDQSVTGSSSPSSSPTQAITNTAGEAAAAEPSRAKATAGAAAAAEDGWPYELLGEISRVWRAR
jgi:hypothetical protein